MKRSFIVKHLKNIKNRYPNTEGLLYLLDRATKDWLFLLLK